MGITILPISVVTEEVRGDYNVSAHVYAIQEVADRRATKTTRKHDQDTSDVEVCVPWSPETVITFIAIILKKVKAT